MTAANQAASMNPSAYRLNFVGKSYSPETFEFVFPQLYPNQTYEI